MLPRKWSRGIVALLMILILGSQGLENQVLAAGRSPQGPAGQLKEITPENLEHFLESSLAVKGHFEPDIW